MNPKLLVIVWLCIAVCGGREGFAENTNLSGVNYAYTPSAQAWKMIRYGNANTDLYTGTCSLTIPVYTYQDEDFSLPVSLDYSYGGLQPNQPTGIVGLGWNLTCGGVITREIRGIPDDFTVGYYTMNGFYHAHKYAAQDFVRDPLDTFVPDPGSSFDEIINGAYNPDDLRVMGLDVNETFHMVLNSKKTASFETDPDLFRFNFLGYSGSFMFGYDNKIHVFDSNVPYGDLTVEIADDTFVRSNSGADSQSVIVLKTGDGYKYTFGGGVSAVDSSYTQYDTDISNIGGYAYETDEMMLPPTAWHLSKIEAPNGKTVEFHYIAKRAIEASYVVTTGHVMVGQIGAEADGMKISNNKEVFSYTYAAIPDEVIIDGQCRINFEYVEKENREGQSNTLLTHPIDLFKESYTNYRYTMPRLSRIEVQDIRDEKYPKMLKNCTLTQTFAAGNPKMFLKRVSLSGEGDYRMLYENEGIQYPNLDTFGIDFWGYWNNRATRDTFIPECTYDRTSLNTLNEETVIGTSRDAVFERARSGALRQMYFPTGGYSQFEYEAHNYNHAVVRSPGVFPHLAETDTKTAGGIRILKITNWDGLQKTIREFSYTAENGSSESSGNLLRMPRYRLFFNVNCFMKWEGRYQIELPSFNFRSMDATHIEYGQVYEKLTNGSVIGYTFANYKDHSDSYIRIDDIGGMDIIQNQIVGMAPMSLYHLIAEPSVSDHCFRGKLLDKTLYDQKMKPVEGDTYEYDNFINGWVTTYRYMVDRFSEHEVHCDNVMLRRHHHYKVADDGWGVGTETVSERWEGREQYVDTKSNGQPTRRTYYFYSEDEVPALASLDRRGAKVAEVTSVLHDDGTEYLTDAAMYDYDPAKATDKPIAVRTALLQNPMEYSVAKRTYTLKDFPQLRSVEYDTIRLRYNESLRLIEVTRPGKRLTSYIWDKDDRYPIARIDNASIARVCASDASFAGLMSSSFAFAELNDMQLQALRDIANGLVTAYKYIPFIGLSEQIDPSGHSTFYSYDSNGRLSEIRDTEGKLVKHYDYQIGNN